jgi:enterochelin esterase-like enzyme
MKKVVVYFLLVSFIVPCYAQTESSFDGFLRQLNQSAIDKRQLLVTQYLSRTKTTPIVEGKNKVHFVWLGQADTVKVEGDLQKSWAIPAILHKIECGEKDFFHISYSVPANALMEYDFIVDGKRTLDPINPRVTQGFDFGDRNIFSMPDFVESPYLNPRYGIDKGTVVQWTFKTSHKLFTNQPISIYRPHGYTDDKTYPVLYVLDGTSSLYSRPYLNVINNLIYDEKIEPIVVVFVGFNERWHDYVEKSSEFGQWIADEMVPFIEKNFSVASSADQRGIIGASASGHAAIVTALRHPEVFGNVASQGGGAGGYPGLNPLANTALDNYLTKKDKTPLRCMYTEVGAFDLEFPQQKIIFSDGVTQFNERLDKAGITYTFKQVSGGHSSKIWDQSLDDILILFFGTSAQASK